VICGAPWRKWLFLFRRVEAPGGRCDEGLAAAPAAYYPVVLGGTAHR